MKLKNLVITCVLGIVFIFLSMITYFKTNTNSLKKEVFEDFIEHYLEKQYESGILKPPLEIAETAESRNNIEYVIKPKDTLSSIFISFEFDPADAKKITNLIQTKVKNFKLNAGFKIDIEYRTIVNYSPIVITNEMNFMPPFEEKNQINILEGLSFLISDGIVEIKRSIEQDGFDIKIIPFQKKVRTIFKEIQIKSSIYQDGIENEISPNVLETLTRIYSFDVDFQRDIREGDKFEILYEEIYDEITGKKLRDGNILFSKLSLSKISKKPFEYYFFNGNYYDGTGKASTKSFLKTPVPAGRLTSRFGLRKHPILGFTKLHSGIDFAAPRGTPVFAAAAGTIEFIGWNGTINTGYGKLIIIKHNATYKTAYAHLNGFRVGLKEGSSVRQGEVIGYVGSTGYSTGPHLHYEVIKNGTKINPAAVTSFSVKTLSKKDLDNFTTSKEEIILKLNEHKG